MSKYSAEDRERILAEGRASIARAKECAPESDLEWAMRQPVPDRAEQWRVDSENQTLRRELEQTRRSMREQARSNAELLAEVDKRIDAAITQEHIFMCGINDPDAAEEDIGLLADLLRKTNRRIEDRIEAAVKPLKEEIAKLHENNLASLSNTMDKLGEVHAALVQSNRTNPDNAPDLAIICSSAELYSNAAAG
jgi:hypothetical protein